MRKAILIAVLLLLLPVHAFAGVVASGSVSLANAKLSTVNGTAFVDFSSAGVFDSYIGLKLTIRSVTGGGTITGWIKAMGTSETLGADLLNGWNLTSGWNVSGGTITDATTATASASTLEVYKNMLTNGALYKGSFDGTPQQGIVKITDVSGGKTYVLDGATGSYFTASLGFWNIFNTGTANTKTLVVVSQAVQQVTAPSATGCTIETAKGSGVMNWTTTGTFTLSDAAGYTYTIERQGAGGGILFTGP